MSYQNEYLAVRLAVLTQGNDITKKNEAIKNLLNLCSSLKWNV